MNYLARTIYSALGLAVVGVGIATWAYNGPLKEKVEAVEKRVEAARLFPFAPSTVVGGELQARGEASRFVRAGNTWRIAEPADALAETDVIEKLIVAIASIVSDAKLDGESAADEATLKKYGLAEPRVKVELDLGAAGKVELALGDKSEFDGRIYVANLGTKRLGLADPSLLGAVDRDLYSLRDKRIFFFETREVTSLETARGDRTLYRLERTGDDWKLAGKDARTADALEAVHVVEALRMLRAAKFIDDSGTGDATFLAKWGLEPPAYRATIALDGGKTLVLRLGGARDEIGRMRWYARVDGEKTLVEVHETFYRELEKTPLDLQDKSIITVVADQVKRVELKTDALAAELEKTDAGWSLVAPKKQPARADKIATLLYTLSHLRAKRFDTNGAAAADLARTGLAKDAKGSVRLLGDGGKVLAHLLIGNDVASEPGAVFVMAAGSGRIDVLDRAKLTLPQSVAELAAPAAP